MSAGRSTGWLQTPLWEPQISWKATPVAQLPAWTDAKRVCVDVECRDDNLYDLGPGVRRGGYVCGIAFAIEDGPAHYLPIRHEGGGNLPEQQVWAYLRDQSDTFGGEVVFNSAPYDLDYLWDNKVEFKKAIFHRDVQVGEPLLDELPEEVRPRRDLRPPWLARQGRDRAARARQGVGRRSEEGSLAPPRWCRGTLRDRRRASLRYRSCARRRRRSRSRTCARRTTWSRA